MKLDQHRTNVSFFEEIISHPKAKELVAQAYTELIGRLDKCHSMIEGAIAGTVDKKELQRRYEYYKNYFDEGTQD